MADGHSKISKHLSKKKHHSWFCFESIAPFHAFIPILWHLRRDECVRLTILLVETKCHSNRIDDNFMLFMHEEQQMVKNCDTAVGIVMLLIRCVHTTEYWFILFLFRIALIFARDSVELERFSMWLSSIEFIQTDFVDSTRDFLNWLAIQFVC